MAKAQELPFELGTDVNIDTYLDYLPLTLRAEKQRAIFKVQAVIITAFREFLVKEGFTEFQAPNSLARTQKVVPTHLTLNILAHRSFGAKSTTIQANHGRRF